MLNNAKETSDFTQPIYKVIQVHHFSVNHSQSVKKTKKVQKYTTFKNAGVAPLTYKYRSASTDPLEKLDDQIIITSQNHITRGVMGRAKGHSDNKQSLNKIKSWRSIRKMYGNADTTHASEANSNGKRNMSKNSMNNIFLKCSSLSKNMTELAPKCDGDGICNSFRKTKQFDSKTQTKLTGQDIQEIDRKQSKKYKYSAKKTQSHKCKCGTEKKNTNIKFEVRPTNKKEVEIDNMNKDISCKEGPCKEAHRISKPYDCRCYKPVRTSNIDSKLDDLQHRSNITKHKNKSKKYQVNKKPIQKYMNTKYERGDNDFENINPELPGKYLQSPSLDAINNENDDNMTVNFSNIASNTTISEIRDKIKCLCQKLKTRLDNKYTEVKRNKEIKIKQRSKARDARITDINQKFEGLCHKCSQKFQSKSKISDCICGPTEKDPKIVCYPNKSDQTGGPLFEIKVSAIDTCACVLNPTEVKDKILRFGKLQRTCICPSHKKRMKQILRRQVCASGPCQKASKNKSTYFSCKCQKECTDKTCEDDNVKFELNKRNINNTKTKSLSQATKINEPFLDVTIDKKNMSLINSNGVMEQIKKLNKIKLKAVNKDDTCSSGICKDKKEIYGAKTRFKCKCIDKKHKPGEILECSDKPKNVDVTKDIEDDTRVENLSKHKTRLQHLKSKVSCLCKSESLATCMKKRRRNKQRKRKKKDNLSFWSRKRGKECSHSDTFHKRTGIKVSLVRYHEDRNVPKHSDTVICVCEERKVEENEKYKVATHIKRNSLHNKNDEVAVDGTYICGVNKKNIHEKYNRDGLHLPTEKRDEKSTDGTCCVCGNDKSCCKCDNSSKITNSSKIYKSKNNDKKYSPSSKHKANQRRHTKKKKGQRKSNSYNDIQESKEEKKKRKEEERYAKMEEKRNRKEKIKQDKIDKQQLKELKALSDDNTQQSNIFVDLFIGLLKVAMSTVKTIFYIIYKVTFHPKKSYKYAKLRLSDPKATYIVIRKWMREQWTIKKLQVAKSMSGSYTMNILTDTLQDSGFYQALAFKGRTQAEKNLFEVENKRRKTRIRKRHNEAVYGCRHILLTTLRKTPCLWVYHICPNLYPQCLGLLTFFKNFTDILVFLLAFAVWTPCIACCELGRALMCCCFCTG